jgi:hypothetical protein
MNVAIVWDIAPCSPYMNRRFEGHLLHVGFLFGWFFYSEDGGDTFLRNIGSHTDYTALYPIIWQLSFWSFVLYSVMICYCQMGHVHATCNGRKLSELFSPCPQTENNTETQKHWISGLCPSSGIINTRKHNVSKTEPVSTVRWGEGDSYPVGPLINSLPQSLDLCRCLSLWGASCCVTYIYYINI